MSGENRGKKNVNLSEMTANLSEVSELITFFPSVSAEYLGKFRRPLG